MSGPAAAVTLSWCVVNLTASYMETSLMSQAILPHRWCVGIDLHKDSLTLCVFCPCCGEIRFQKIACRCRTQIAEFFSALPRPHVVAIEAVGFYRWLWGLAGTDRREVGAGRRHGQPAHWRAARLKTDREDAQNVAELLAVGRLPLAYLRLPWRCRSSRTKPGIATSSRDCIARVLHQVKSLMNANNDFGPARRGCRSHGLIRYLKAFESKVAPRHAAITAGKCVDQLTLIERQMALRPKSSCGTCSRRIASAETPGALAKPSRESA